MGLEFKSLDEEGRMRFAQFMVGSARSIVERYFQNETLISLFSAGCMSANYASLHQPGSAMPMLHHAVGELDGVKGQWGLAKGGMGAITQAMAKFCKDNNVTIKTDADVENIIIKEGKAIGARLKNGEEFFSKVVLTNTDPNRTFKKLVKPEHLDEKFVKDIDMWRMESASMRMNLALNGLPNFKALPSTIVGDHHKCSISIVHSAEAIEEAYRSARKGELPENPIMEILIPSTMDDSLTQPGHHVMSMLCKYVPYQLSGGRHWNDERENAADHMINYLRNYITNLDEILVARQVLTPWDIEQRFGMTRGDICHGRLEPDQLFSMRPHPQCAQYATPIQGLYLCGSGTHPGGGVTGAPGHNAAKRVLKDWRYYEQAKTNS
jgi:phytoene dehydrogenase-like protein